MVGDYFENENETEYLALSDIQDFVNQNEEVLTYKIVVVDDNYRIAVNLGDCMLVDVDDIKFKDRLYSRRVVANLVYKLFLKSYDWKFQGGCIDL